MRKIILFIIILLSFFKMNACSCNIPKSIVEFSYSKYVFEGIVSSKIYASDSLTYTVTFDIGKHYKNGDSPEKLSFSFKSEAEYTGMRTSCDWSVDKNEKWLVYAYTYKGELTFGYYCSNSKPLDYSKIDPPGKQILKNGNQFVIDKYIFSSIDGIFSNSKPKKDIDSILQVYKKNNYKANRVDIIVDIDAQGNLVAANLWSKSIFNRPDDIIIDTIFNLNKPANVAVRNPENRAEKDFLELVRNLKRWEKTFLPHSDKAIKYRKYLQFYPREDTIIMAY